jgi:thiol-disulfide isomerase/thioredoxin
VALNFWAGQCPPCRAEMPAFQRVYDRHSDDFLLVGVDSNVSRKGTIRYRIMEDGTGTRIVCNRHREFYGIRGYLAGTVMKTLGAMILRRQLRRGLERSTRLHAAR